MTSKHDMWSYQPPISEDRPLHEHIDALWAAVKGSVDFVKALKSRATVDVFLGYCSNIDHRHRTSPPVPGAVRRVGGPVRSFHRSMLR
jgi:hypothetical protein